MQFVGPATQCDRTTCDCRFVTAGFVLPKPVSLWSCAHPPARKLLYASD